MIIMALWFQVTLHRSIIYEPDNPGHGEHPTVVVEIATIPNAHTLDDAMQLIPEILIIGPS